MPKVSICIPAYNQVVYLKRTLDSILRQTYQDYELVITDDSSNNDVKNLVDSYNFNDRLKYYYNEVSLGSPTNWNYCIGKARGEYIKIMHHDDWFTNERSLEVFVKAIENSKADFVFSNAKVNYVKSNKSGIHSPGNSNVLKLKEDKSILFIRNFIGDPSMIIYKRYPNMFFDEALKWLVDVDFYIMFLRKYPRFAYIDQPLLTISAEIEQSVTSQCLNVNVEMFENLYLFKKLNESLNYGEKNRSINHLLSVMKRYNISSITEIKSFGVEMTFFLTAHIYIYILKRIAKQMLRNLPKFMKLNNHKTHE